MPGSLIIIVPASVGSIAWERYSGARSFVLCTVLGQLQVLYPPVLRYVILLDHRLAKANCNSPLTGRLPSAGPGVCAVMCAVKRRMCRILGGVRQCLATEMSGHQKPPTRQLCFSANFFCSVDGIKRCASFALIILVPVSSKLGLVTSISAGYKFCTLFFISWQFRPVIHINESDFLKHLKANGKLLKRASVRF